MATITTQTSPATSHRSTRSAWKRFILGALLLDFTVLYLWAVATLPFSEWIPTLTQNIGSVQLVVDLAFALGIGIAWMVADARRRGRKVTPYVLLTVVFGAGGLLTYLFVGSLDARE